VQACVRVCACVCALECVRVWEWVSIEVNEGLCEFVCVCISMCLFGPPMIWTICRLCLTTKRAYQKDCVFS
jgi:hypothetical protein